VDAAIDSAQNLPLILPAGVDWLWLSRPENSAGALALLFRSGDPRWLRLRSLLVKPVVFAGAGPGSEETCTLGALAALQQCEVCLHDSLIDPSLLKYLPAGAQQINAGKSCGHHNASQDRINSWLADFARRGQRVVRLKSGDPGIFGRLAEETEALDNFHLPYRVIPGVSSLNAATTGTGMLLTRRGISRGFSVITPRKQNGGIGSIAAKDRASLPLVFFMGILVIKEIVDQLVQDGLPAETPVAVVFDAGTNRETTARGCLADIAGKLADGHSHHRGLVIVGSAAADGYHDEWGALMDRRVLLDADLPALKQSIQEVRDFGGVPIPVSFTPVDPEWPPIFDALITDNATRAVELLSSLPARHRDAKIIVAGNDATRAALTEQGISFDRILVPTTLSATETLAAFIVRAELAKIAHAPRRGVRNGAGPANSIKTQIKTTN
jgi:uroporphyrin-III C-methyltransferase